MIRIALIIVTILICLPLCGQISIIEGDSLVFVEKSLKKLNKNVNFTIIPGPVYGATQNLGFAVLPMLVYNLDKQDKLSPPSSSALMVFLDFHGSWNLAVKQSLYWNQNKWRAFFMAGLGKMQLRFFGIGRDTSIIDNDPANYDWVTQSLGNFSMSCYRKVVSSLYAGLEYNYTYSRVDARDSSGIARLNKEGFSDGETTRESLLVPTLVWDNRDNIYWSVKGYYSSLNFILSNRFLLSSINFGVINGQASGYYQPLKCLPRFSVAWNLYLQAAWGNLPYTRYADYGRGDKVTGYSSGKYTDYSEISIQTEFRYEVWKFIAAGVYAGTGKIFPSFDRFGPSVWLHFGGLRTYVNIIPSRNIRLRLDAAIGRKDWGFYVGIGQGI